MIESDYLNYYIQKCHSDDLSWKTAQNCRKFREHWVGKISIFKKNNEDECDIAIAQQFLDIIDLFSLINVSSSSKNLIYKWKTNALSIISTNIEVKEEDFLTFIIDNNDSCDQKVFFQYNNLDKIEISKQNLRGLFKKHIFFHISSKHAHYLTICYTDSLFVYFLL